ncbi:fibrinogen alpha chain [Elgaria multicarinata webbii]|uniref:fibrinogen alpha chain n=1 Tax=Elgaria multicarinata webbii TaxID=159646 RepID=UPI002FCD633A
MFLKIFCALLCFSVTWATENGSTFEDLGGSARGSRIVEHKTQAGCLQESNAQACSDEDWGKKCPSGCRMQGLIHETDQDFNNRIGKIRKLLTQNLESYKSSNILKQEITNIVDRNVNSEQQISDSYGQTSDNLRSRLVILQQRVLNHVNKIKTLQNTIQTQVGEIKRLEVDIDIKLRACKGSCGRVQNYNVDTEGYDNIQKQLIQASTIKLQPEFEATPLRVLKMRPLKDSTVPSHFKTKAPLSQQEAETLNRLQIVEAILENSGDESRGSPVDHKHVVPRPGAAGQPHTTKLVTTTTTTSGGGGANMKVVRPDTAHYTQTCVRTVTTKVIRGPDGEREETVEQFRAPDGSDCSHVQGFEKEAGGSTYHIKGTSGVVGSGSLDLSLLPSEAREFFSGSKLHTDSTFHSTGTFDGPDFSDLGEGEDDFTRFDHSSAFESRTSGGSTHSVSSSSSTSGFNKGGSTFETKSIKVPGFSETEWVQHDQSGEDNPDFQARSLNPGGQKQGESYIGTDCEDIRQKHTSGSRSGLFKIKPAGSAKGFSVYCDQETTLGGWLLIQQRLDGSLNFNGTWHDFKNGFGKVDNQGKGELWLGNEKIHVMTRKDTVLRVEMEDWEGNKVYAEYNMQVSSESEGYQLIISNYEGTAGDALIKGSEEGGSQYTSHANMTFSTFDRDSDQWEENCAEMYGGGWWYNNCQAANLNGIYYTGGQYDPRNNVPYEIENGVVWVTFRPSDYSLKAVRMKIRPIETE